MGQSKARSNPKLTIVLLFWSLKIIISQSKRTQMKDCDVFQCFWSPINLNIKILPSWSLKDEYLPLFLLQERLKIIKHQKKFQIADFKVFSSTSKLFTPVFLRKKFIKTMQKVVKTSKNQKVRKGHRPGKILKISKKWAYPLRQPSQKILILKIYMYQYTSFGKFGKILKNHLFGCFCNIFGTWAKKFRFFFHFLSPYTCPDMCPQKNLFNKWSNKLP